MGRNARFSREEIVDATRRLASSRGPSAVTIADVAHEIGAPTGSIYHRFRSRDLLLAELWMRVVEGFQVEFVAALAPANDLAGGVGAARFTSTWVRGHETDARLLLLHRRQDFVATEIPDELRERAAALEPQLGRALRGYSQRAFGRADADAMARVRFALLDAPLGGVKPYLQAGKAIPKLFDTLIGASARAVLEPLVES